MKKLIFTFSFIIASVVTYGQSCIYQQSFENPVTGITSTGTPGFVPDTLLYHDGVQSYHGTFNVSDSAIITTDDVNLTGNTFVILKFWHICKLQFFDQGIVQVSSDGGLNWTQLTCLNSIYLGASITFCAQANKFSEASYPATWHPNDTMLQADSSWWREEQFDVSALLGSGTVTNAKVRFVAHDLNTPNDGMGGRQGWFIDEVCLLAAPCELTPPGLVFASPVYSGNVYNNGPYTYNVKVGDNSGVASVFLSISLNGAPPDTLAMTNPVPGDSLWTVSPPDTFNLGDTICYHYFAYDASPCINLDSTTELCFIVTHGEPLTYCDNFDGNNIWTDSLGSGSPWELGTPAFGQTNNTHSPPNAWDIALTTAYLSSSEAYLTSPIFDFSSAVNSKVNVWLNYNSEDSWDGTRLEYTSDGGTTWQIVGTSPDPNATNWYEYFSIGSSGLPGWSGSSGGWKNAIREMVEPVFTLNPNPIQFRFVFTSDAIIVTDGFSIDDFCIKLPQPQDVGVSTIFLPNALYPSGATADVKVMVKNFGLNAATNFDVYYTYNGVTSAPTNYPGVLAAGAQDTVYCPQFTVLGGTFQFCAYTNLTGDGDHFNDTLCLNVSGIQQVSITYCNTFDVNGSDWTPIPSPNSSTTWELGTPNFGATNTPHTPPNSWDINLNFGYDVDAETYLLSPIFDFSIACNARMEFWQNRNTQFFWDGARLDYSINGSPWTILGAVGDTLATNWYTTSNIFSSGLDAWDGTSNGWIKSTYNMNGYNSVGLFQLRFAFNSTTFTTGDGISIDDFCMINPPAEDIGVDSIINPTPLWGMNQLSDVNVQVRNFGCNPITNFDVYYTVSGGTPVGPATYTGVPIGPSQTVVVSCAQFTVPAGNYDFCAYTVLATDGDNSNDTTCTTPKGVPAVPLTYCNDFDSTGADWTAVPSPTGVSVWELGTPNYGATNSAHSTPNAWDVNLNAPYDFGSETYLISPFFDFGTSCNPRMQFWQNINTQQAYDGGRMDININGLGWNILGSVGDTNAANWYTNAAIFATNQPAWDGNSQGWIKSTYSMNAYSGIGLVQLRFAFNSTNFSNGDGMSIDDFCIINPPADDVGVDAVIEPFQNWAAGQLSNVTLRVRNFGCNPITNFDVYYTVNGGTPVGPITYTGTSIPTNGTINISCAQFSVPPGIYDFCGFTVMATDGDNSNDTLCVQHKGVPVDTLNYCDNFDGASANDWTPLTIFPGSAWELGIPAYGTTSGAHSAPNAWDINLTAVYLPDANAELISPFFDMTLTANAQLSFWQNRSCEPNFDGARIDYSLNGGLWTTLGYQGDPLGTNWYTNNAIFSTGLPAWDGTSNGWIKSEYVMSAFDSSGLLQLKFVFNSDGSVQYDGFSIDDFCLRVPPPQDAGCNGIVSPAGGLVSGNTYFPTFEIKNYGSANMDSIPVTYTINGSSPVTEYYYPVIIPNNTGLITFTQGFTAQPGGFTLCIYTGLPADGDHFNDSCCTTLVGIPTLIPTYTDNFDGGNNGWTTNNITPGTIWELGNPSFGQTTGSHSPPNCWDVNLFSAYQNNANCELISPYFDFTNVINAEVSFWINYNTAATWDGPRLDYSSDGGVTFNPVGYVGCPGCTNWFTSPSLNSNGKPGWEGTSAGWIFARDSDLSFLNANPSPVIFKFVFESAFVAFNVDGASIDDFTLFKPITITAGTKDVYPLNHIFTPGPQYIVGRYTNKGTTPLNSVVLTLNIDNNTFVVTDTINPIPGAPLNLNKDTTHVFSLPWNASPGQHLFCIYTSYPNGGPDLDNGDDTTCAYIVVFDSTSAYPYCNDFESGPQWVALNSVTYTATSSWQFGTPVKVNLIGSHSGAKCWVTNLVSNYPNNDESSLFSPVFNVKANSCYNLDFWQNFDMDLYNDGGTIEYSLDSASTWNQFGTGGDQYNWMNATYIAAFGGPPIRSGWTGFTGSWVESNHNFESLQNGTVIFRWRFASDQTNNADGWAIDDVCFTEVTSPCVTSVGEPLTEGFYLYQNIPNPASDVTKIRFSLPARGKAELKVTNVMGQVVDIPVSNVVKDSGIHTVDLNVKNLIPGIYYYSLRFDEKTITRRMVITN